ncbi:MAG TPA: ROK family transcriptional regulator [Clostridiaceae bacterium]|nr:ROK family transcriptional regulator [Clostridiaceae bacterium]
MKKIDISQNQELVRLRNQKRVLFQLSENKMMTIRSLSETLDLSAPTIISILDHLIKMQLVKECGQISTKVGRKPVLYSINEKYKRIIAIDLGQNNMFIGVSDLNCEFEEIIEEPLNYKENDFSLSDYLTKAIENLLKKNAVSLEDVASIVIGNVGIVDEKTGSISYAAGTAIWSSQPIKLHLKEKFSCPIIVKNDVNLSTIGERKSGNTQGFNSFAFFRFDVGVKAGIVIDNKLYEGHDGAAGEIGFASSSMYKDLSSFNNRIEEELTIKNVCATVYDEIKNNGNSTIFRYIQKNNKSINAKLLGDYYLTDTVVNKILSDYLIRLGNLIIIFVSIMNVPLVILGGDIVNFGEEFLINLQKYIDKNCFYPPQIRYSTIKEHSGLIGGASIGIDAFLSSVH